MPIRLDQQLREQIAHRDSNFPISFYHDELEQLPDWSGPLHWHPEFEIATAVDAALDYQVGKNHLKLEPGDSIFVNGNMLHGIRQINGACPDPMPNIVFAGALIAPENSLIYSKYIQPMATCSTLPFVLFRHDDDACASIHAAIREIYACLSDQRPCFEMTVQRNLILVFEYITLHFDALPKLEASRVQISTQIRMQQMLAFIFANYAKDITLNEIARSANVSRSEAGRCFQTYMACSPMDALIKYRLHMAHTMLRDSTKSILEISSACGFHSANYFTRQFHRYYGYTPRSLSNLGKSC